MIIGGFVNETTEMVEVKFLHPQGPAPSFTYPTDFDDKLEVPVPQILTLVDPKCPTGWTYYMCKEEMDAVTAALKNYLARDSWTCYEIKTSDDHPLPHTR